MKAKIESISMAGGLPLKFLNQAESFKVEISLTASLPTTIIEGAIEELRQRAAKKYPAPFVVDMFNFRVTTNSASNLMVTANFNISGDGDSISRTFHMPVDISLSIDERKA